MSFVSACGIEITVPDVVLSIWLVFREAQCLPNATQPGVSDSWDSDLEVSDFEACAVSFIPPPPLNRWDLTSEIVIWGA